MGMKPADMAARIARGMLSWTFLGGESFKAQDLDRLNPQTQTYTTD